MDSDRHCEEHPEATIAGNCIRCGKPVCVMCVEQRGYFCSDSCKAEQTALVPVPDETKTRQKKEMERQARLADAASVWLFKRIPVGVLVFAAAAATLYFMDRSGKERWAIEPPRGVSFVDVVLAGGSVFVLRSDGVCQALAASDGRELWQANLERKPGTAPEEELPFGFGALPERGSLIAEDSVLFHRGPGEVSALSADSGRTLWRRSLDRMESTAPSLAAGRLLFAESKVGGRMPSAVSAGNPFSFADHANARLVCVDATSGGELWTRDYEKREITSLGIRGETCFCVSCRPPIFEWVPCAAHKSARPAAMVDCPECKYRMTRASSFEVNVMRARDGAPLWSGALSSGSFDEVRLLPDGLCLLVGRHLYVVTPGGEKKAHSRIPKDAWKKVVTDDRVIAGARDGRILAFSSRDGSAMWETKVEGRVWNLEATPEAIYVEAGMPKKQDGKSPDGTPEAPAPLSPQMKLFREFQGQYKSGATDTEDLFRPECRTLVSYRPESGAEQWRLPAFVGSLSPLPDGNFLLLAQGHEAAALFLKGSGSVLSEHMRKNGRECWRFKIPQASYLVKANKEFVYLLAGAGYGIMGQWSEEKESNGGLHAIRRRTFVNKLRKL